MLIHIKLSRVDVFMRLLSLDFTRFIVENEHSQSTMLTGTTAAIEASLESCRYMSCREASVQSRLVICRIDMCQKLAVLGSSTHWYTQHCPHRN